MQSPEPIHRIHPARDLLRESLERSGEPPAGDTYLVMTHRVWNPEKVGGERRYDSIWATPEFELQGVGTYYEEAEGPEPITP